MRIRDRLNRDTSFGVLQAVHRIAAVTFIGANYFPTLQLRQDPCQFVVVASFGNSKTH
jgi:hypothetical protein